MSSVPSTSNITTATMLKEDDRDLDYRCIECGHIAQELYKDLKAGVIKITHCDECERVVDKYIEFDNTVIFLDALLHKPQAYRHLLFNIHISSPWKLLLILMLCDTYLKWANLHSGAPGQDTQQKVEDYIFYAAVEWDFYRMFVVALSEWLTFSCTVWGLVHLRESLGSQPKTNKTRTGTLMTGLIVSSFGKLLAIPAVIWGQTHSAIYLLLTQIFIFTSNVTALRVLCSCSRRASLTMVAVAVLLETGAGLMCLHLVMA